MLQKKQIDTLVLPTGKYWVIVFYLIVICLSILTLFVFLALRYHNDVLFIVGVLLAIAPAIFIRLKINLIAKKATIDFSEEFIEIKTQDPLSDRLIYSNIKYFSVSNIDVDHASIIKFVLGNGTKKRYIFFRQFDNDDNILNNVLLYFSSYNIGKIQEEKIQVLPSFFLTKAGKQFVGVTACSILAAIIIQVIYKPKAIPASLFVVLAGYIQIKIIQMNDRKILKKFLDEN
ncbi:hypothetical protein [Mucilaginibacter sp.]|uniref:hypothetical protein n=1 Tax=Mucilaginibacter sp. TaxID=1882438 RepID=UPI00374D41CA